MINHRDNIILAIVIAIFSVGAYCLQIIIFEDPRSTVFYLLQDLAFVPIQVAIVTLFFNRLLNSREKAQKKKRINVIITAFYIEAGSAMITEMAKFNLNFDEFRKKMATPELTLANIPSIKAAVKSYDFVIDAKAADLDYFKVFSKDQKPIMLSMLDNTTLLAHDSFTDMMWATFHVIDELQSRETLSKLPESDLSHLSGDLLRAYRLLILEWLDYIGYLSKEYPYLYSLAVRKNPFNDEMDVTVY